MEMEIDMDIGESRKILARTTGRLLAAVALAASALTMTHAAEGKKAQEVIKDWPQVSQKAAKSMVESYGQPGEVTSKRLIWEGNFPWKRTIVYKEPIDHDFPKPHKDVLEQVVPYGVDPDMFDELAEFDGSVIAERTKGELAARCDREAANFLAVNLANEILQGEKTVEEARQAYAEAMKALMQGNPPTITRRFTFQVPRNYTGDPDESIMQSSKQ